MLCIKQVVLAWLTWKKWMVITALQERQMFFFPAVNKTHTDTSTQIDLPWHLLVNYKCKNSLNQFTVCLWMWQLEWHLTPPHPIPSHPTHTYTHTQYNNGLQGVLIIEQLSCQLYPELHTYLSNSCKLLLQML